MRIPYIPTVLIVIVLENVWGTLTPIVKTRQGKVRGVRSLSGQNRYYGIPYAVSKRFQPPRPPPKWRGVMNAVNRFGSCAQTVSFLETGTEDCLELDVFTPSGVAPEERLPVLVWIHGGGYYYGSKWHYDPQFLVAQNIVAVILNYRVGVFGFLCVDGISNLGLKDQVAALRWIRQNIAAFGGDPDNVTLAGQSAGASAAAMHMLSRSSAGLFHKLFLMSGTPFAPWAFNLENEASALRDARKIRDMTSDESLLDIFSTATVKEILQATKDTSINPRHFKYAPCIDTNFTAAFFHDTPYGAITSGQFNKVPIISGAASAEGMLFYGLHDDHTLQQWDDEFVDRLPAVFSCATDRKSIAEALKAYYFPGKKISREAKRGIVDFYSDWIVFATEDAFARLLTSHSPQRLYRYIFAYEGSRNFAKALFYRERAAGASHSDDIFYVFQPGGARLPLTARDSRFVARLATMLANFMKSGEPTPRVTSLVPLRWPAFTANCSVVLKLDHQLSLVPPSTSRGRLLRELLCRHGEPGYVPCRSHWKCPP